MKKEFDFVCQVARKAGAIMLDAFARTQLTGYTLKGQQDYLTETDLKIEVFVRSAIEVAFPGDSVLGEETGGATQAHRLWVVDPIDGTANFARSIPHFCISIALLIDGRPQLGVVYDPVHDELFSAVLGGGARCNGVALQTSSTPQLHQAAIEIGWNNRRSPAAFLALVQNTLEAGCAFRRAGSAALGLAYVAAGRSDAYLELHVNVWDVAAGVLLVSEAGGCVSDYWSYNALAQGNAVLASNSQLFEPLNRISGIGA